MKAAEHPAAGSEAPKGRSLGGWIVLVLILLAGYGFAGMLTYGGLFTHGGAVMFYIFIGAILGLAGAYIKELGARFGYGIFFAFQIGFPIVKLILPRTAWGRERIRKAEAAAKKTIGGGRASTFPLVFGKFALVPEFGRGRVLGRRGKLRRRRSQRKLVISGRNEISNRTISEVLPSRTGGPQVPAPLVTLNHVGPFRNNPQLSS